jgi:colanic acid/amylovoran biosynthesis glycosyltransferase
MRIAYLVNQYPSVSHTFIRREIRALERLGHVIDRFSIRPSSTQTVVDDDDRVEATQTTVVLQTGKCLAAACLLLLQSPLRFGSAMRLSAQLYKNSGRGLIRHLAYLAEACRLRVELRRRKTEWLHAHFGTNPAAVAALCRRLGGPPFSFTVHGPEEFDRPVTESLSLKIASADLVIAVSSFGRSQLQRWCRHDQWSKIRIVRCGIDEPLLSSPIVDVPANHRFVCVGRLVEQKGHLTLLNAAAIVAKQYPDFELTLVGDGPLRPEIEAFIRQENLAKHVRITGWQSGSQVLEHLAAARCLVLPSFAEGLPVVIMEAFALGRPVITTYIAGIPELVTDRTNGWLVAAGEVSGLAERMQECLDAPIGDLQTMAGHGKNKVREMHAVDAEAGRLAGAFASADLP